MVWAMLCIAGPVSAQESRIAFVSDRDGNEDIYVMNSDGSDRRRLTAHPGVDRAPALSPDGRQLAFVSDRSGQAALYLMSLESGNVTPLLQSRAPWLSLSSSRMAWSPDGEHLAYTITESEKREIFIEVLSLRTGATKRLQRGMAPSWSPDGSRIAFNKGQVPQIAVMSSSGGKSTLLLKKAEGSFSVDLLPAWSPDGERILFTSLREFNEGDAREQRMDYEVYVQRLDDKFAVRLTDAPGRDQAWAWSPDGTRFVFTTSRDVNSEIYVGDSNGGDVRNLTRHPARDTEPSWSRAASVAE